ncbi:MAG: DUF3365 domain-containing protein [bacterium]|nr:DUF3365 domain-containing protein [bacterium]
MKPTLRADRMFTLLSISLFLALTISYLWRSHVIHISSIELARTSARIAYEKDVIYRRWNAMNGGVYVKNSEKTPPNPYLSDIPERDVTTPTGKPLTLVNPAYMTRQVHEIAQHNFGIYSHITSLRPIRPENKADAWESIALSLFEKGEKEYSSVEMISEKEYMRLMRPLYVEQSCLDCHAKQGYKMGEVRGGISVAVPMLPLYDVEQKKRTADIFGHLIFWGIAQTGLAMLWHRLRKSDIAMNAVRIEQENTIRELQAALQNIKQLSGLIPICSSCKKIRDDRGYWTQVEEYISHHTVAEFSHSVCPECIIKLYPEYAEEIFKNVSENQTNQ